MRKYTIFLTILICSSGIPTVYAQGGAFDSKVRTVSGTVANVDFVGSTISILTPDQNHMSFYVPGNVIITSNTHDIGLMDIKPGHPVVVKYNTLTPGRDIVLSIVDNPAGRE